MKMEKYTNESGKECYKDVEMFTPFDGSLFHEWKHNTHDEYQRILHTNLGSLTVLDRMTGFGWRDTETGFRDPEGKFWLASGGVNVIASGCKTVGEAIDYVKTHANTCVPTDT
jgi:hypothetical protein